MTKSPAVCRETDTIQDAVMQMEAQDCGVIPVCDSDNRCVGIVTDRDLCLEVVLNNLDPKSVELKTVLSKNLVSCSPDEDIYDVLSRMKQQKIRRIVVTNQKEQCVGIISEKDLVDGGCSQQALHDMKTAVHS